MCVAAARRASASSSALVAAVTAALPAVDSRGCHLQGVRVDRAIFAVIRRRGVPAAVPAS